MLAGLLHEVFPDSYPCSSPGCRLMEPQLGGGGNFQGKVLIRMRWEGVILTLQLPPLAHGFPSQGPGPGTRHLVVAEDGPLGLRQLLVETGTVQRGPVQPSRHRHSSGCSQKPCSALQPARHTTIGDGEAEGKRNTDKGRVRRTGSRAVSECFLCTTLFHPWDSQPSGLDGTATLSLQTGKLRPSEVGCLPSQEVEE